MMDQKNKRIMANWRSNALTYIAIMNRISGALDLVTRTDLDSASGDGKKPLHIGIALVAMNLYRIIERPSASR